MDDVTVFRTLSRSLSRRLSLSLSLCLVSRCLSVSRLSVSCLSLCLCRNLSLSLSLSLSPALPPITNTQTNVSNYVQSFVPRPPRLPADAHHHVGAEQHSEYAARHPAHYSEGMRPRDAGQLLAALGRFVIGPPLPALGAAARPPALTQNGQEEADRP